MKKQTHHGRPGLVSGAHSRLARAPVWQKLFALTMAVLLAGSATSPAQDDLEQRASWQVPDPVAVRVELDEWLDSLKLDESARDEIEEIWGSPDEIHDPRTLLQRLTESIAVAHSEAGELVRKCTEAPTAGTLVELDWLEDEPLPGLVRHNLRLLYSVHLVQQSLYDEALEQLGSLGPDQVVDPGALLFHQAVVHHRLLNREPCLEAISQLLKNKRQIPERYASIAALMEADIRPLEEDSLDEVARLMEDVQRRLRLRRAGTRVREEEATVIAKLDKMIEELEEQQQQQQGGGASQGNNSRSDSPAEDSAPLGGRGPGDVDEREIGDSSGWGNLPPKERQEALQQISKDLPAHYRGVIEEYFRKLARDDGS